MDDGLISSSPDMVLLLKHLDCGVSDN